MVRQGVKISFLSTLLFFHFQGRFETPRDLSRILITREIKRRCTWILLTARSVNLRAEFRQIEWKKTPTLSLKFLRSIQETRMQMHVLYVDLG